MKLFSKKYQDPGDGTTSFPNPQRSKNTTFYEDDGTGVRFGSIRKKKRK